MTAMFRGNRPARSVGASRKHVYEFRKNGAAKQPGRATMSSKQQRELVEVASLANNLLAKMLGQAK